MRVEKLDESPRECNRKNLCRNHCVFLLVFTSVKLEELFVLFLNSLLEHYEEADIQANVEDKDEYGHDRVFDSTELEC